MPLWSAYKELRKEWISEYIILISIIVIAIAVACSKFMNYANKVNRRVATSGEKKTYWKELLYAFHVMLHPFDGFWDLKHEKRGSVRAASTILAATIFAFYYQAIRLDDSLKYPLNQFQKHLQGPLLQPTSA